MAMRSGRSRVEGADRPPGELATCNLRQKGVAMSTGFSMTARDLPGVHIVELRGELDIVPPCPGS